MSPYESREATPPLCPRRLWFSGGRRAFAGPGAVLTGDGQPDWCWPPAGARSEHLGLPAVNA